MGMVEIIEVDDMVRIFSVTNIQKGYGKGTFAIQDQTGRIYPSGGLLKTPTRARNYLLKLEKKFRNY